MSTHSITASAEEHVADVSFLIANLNSNPRTIELVPIVEPALASLREQIATLKLQQTALVQSQAKLVSADRELDDAIRRAHPVLFKVARRLHGSPQRVVAVPRGVGDFTSASHLDKVAVVLAIAQRCAQDASPKAQAHSSGLTAVAERLAFAFSRRQASVISVLSSLSELQIRKLKALLACHQVWCRLAELYPDAPVRISSCFRPGSRVARILRVVAGCERGCRRSPFPSTPQSPKNAA